MELTIAKVKIIIPSFPSPPPFFFIKKIQKGYWLSLDSLSLSDTSSDLALSVECVDLRTFSLGLSGSLSGWYDGLNCCWKRQKRNAKCTAKQRNEKTTFTYSRVMPLFSVTEFHCVWSTILVAARLQRN